MTILVVGASGATGKLLVKELLNRGQKVKAIVRSTEKLSEFLNHKNLVVINASISDLSDAEMAAHVKGCNAVASCLGHNLTFKGLFGQPRRLVTDAVRRFCKAIEVNKPEKPVKYVLMNTTGNRNRDLNEPISFAEKGVFALISLLLPPQSDNEQAAETLRTNIGGNNKLIEWTAVRPDGLIDEKTVSQYTIHPSPTRSAIFNAGKTSRINVAHFMSDLITDNNTWNKWKGQMPVIYNVEI
jgi:NAD(P)-dependent dehydrogenase (short-subunit alcohol dehydrogenase family)